MKTVRRKCKRGYRHYYEHEALEWDGPDEEHSVMRELVLVCARCHHTLYIDSIVRRYMGLKTDDDWGT